MEIGLKLLLNELGHEAEVNLHKDEDAKFSSVELFSTRGADLSGRSLLVCTLTEALAASRREGLYFLCVRDREADAAETPQAMHGIILVRRQMELRELFNQVQRAFIALLNWMLEMERSITRNRGLQELLTISEPVFKNHISIQDSTFKLLAYTRDIETDDPITQALIRHGYHPPETIDIFRKYRRIEEYERSQGIVVSRDGATGKYDVVKKMFHCGESVSILVVMICCGRGATEGLIELFHLLLGYIKVYVERDFLLNNDSSAKKSLAKDLVMKNVQSLEEARIRAMYAGLPFEETFRLLVLSFFDEENVPFSRLVQSFSGAFPDAVVFSSERHILLLEIGEPASGPVQEGQIAALADGLEFRCGVSDNFSSLLDANVAYEQAILALKMSARLQRPPAGDGRFCAFRDYWAHHLLATGVKQAPAAYRNSFYFCALEKLQKYDEEHHTNTLELLHAYLDCDRKATVVSGRLHMHRNTVLYHIGKVENILGISLDDPETRLMILLAYKTRDFEPGALFFEQ